MKGSIRLIPAALLVLASGFASAQVAFDDFSNDSYSPIYGYDPGSGGTIDGSSGPVGYSAWANRFVSGASGTLNQIILPMGYIEGSGNVTVSLWTDNGGTIASDLEQWTMPASGNFGSWNTPSVLTDSADVVLTSGSAYWLMVATADSTTFDAWNFVDNGLTGDIAIDTGSGWNYSGPQTLSAFEITVNSTPEPTTMLALGGMALIAVRRKRRKK